MKYSFDLDELIEAYEYLHSIPEPEFMEFKTSEYIYDFLKNINLTPIKCAKTGIYADIKGKDESKKHILLRADIDALPLEENSGVPYSSTHKGYMHACGHDMHTACLLYAAKALSENTDKFSGMVRVLFQPAEEGAGGALPMIEEGAMKNITAAIAMHVDPLEKTGVLLYKNGGITASPDDYKIVIRGKGGHAAEPEKCINPISIAAEITNEYSNLNSTFLKDKRYVTTVCTCNSGSFNNIIPDSAEITGTARTFDSITRIALKEKLEEIAITVCKKYNAVCDFKYNELFPPTINSPEMNIHLLEAAKITEGIIKTIELSEGSFTGDDFAYFAEKCHSTYYKLGVGGEGERFPLHSSKFKIDKNSLIIGCKLMVNTTVDYLNS